MRQTFSEIFKGVMGGILRMNTYLEHIVGKHIFSPNTVRVIVFGLDFTVINLRIIKLLRKDK